MKRNNKKGFTLVELVIVIAVIAILSAILIPTFGNIIGDANKTSAQSDAKAAITTHMSIVAKHGDGLADGYIVMVDGNNVKYYFEYENGNLGAALEDKPTGCSDFSTAANSGWEGLAIADKTTADGDYGRSTEFYHLPKGSGSQQG